MEQVSYPVIRVGGGPAERGHEYGRLAKAQIHGTIALYKSVFVALAALDWDAACARAVKYQPIIEQFSPSSWQEIVGIANGASVRVAEILAINVRSEIMFQATGSPLAASLAQECTSFGLQPQVTASGAVLAGQNWDWLDGCRSNVIVLEVRRPDGPDFLTLAEAGLLAKVGLNEAGVGLCTNTLVSDGAEGSLGVPYHVLLRSVLDAADGSSAAALLRDSPKANSANYVVVDHTGFVVDLETAPQDDSYRMLEPTQGVVAHANHFLSQGLTGTDKYLARKPHSLNRVANLESSLRADGRLSIEDIKAALADHTDAPSSVCQHPRPEVRSAERTCTLAGVVLDVSARTMHLAAGNPCTAPWSILSI